MLKWLRANTLGTYLFTRRKGVLVGEDELGNKYYRERGAKDWRSERRWLRRWREIRNSLSQTSPPQHWTHN